MRIYIFGNDGITLNREPPAAACSYCSSPRRCNQAAMSISA